MKNKTNHQIMKTAARGAVSGRWLAWGGAVAIAVLSATGCDAPVDEAGSLDDGVAALETTEFQAVGQDQSLTRYELKATDSEVGAVDPAPGGPVTALYPLGIRVHATRAPVIATHPSGIGTIQLFGGTRFLKNDFVQWNKVKIIMQGDGNLVAYDDAGRARWSSRSVGTGDHADFQADANFVMYNASNRPVVVAHALPSNTCCHPGWTLNVQADGNVVIYAPGWLPKWDILHPH